MIEFRNLISCVCLAALMISPAFCQPGCSLRIDKDSVKVYSCKTPDSKIKSIKTVFEVHATSNQVIAMILDVNGYNNWQYHAINAHILEQKSSNELVYYLEIVSPWPASNRDLNVHLKIEHDKATDHINVYANSIPDFIPEKKGIVRVPMSKSQWVVKPLSASRLSVEFTMLVDPGGYVPAWLINMVAAEAPYESFRDFKKKIEKR